jgi:hypothetical protein
MAISSTNGEPSPSSKTTRDGPGYALPFPTSLAELAGPAQVVVQGTIVKHTKTHDVSFGKSSPLGERQRQFDLAIPIASYELRIDRYLVGDGPRTIVFQESSSRDIGLARIGTSGLFFLKPAIVAWGPDGYASHFGRGGVLTTERGAMVFLGNGAGGEKAPFAEGRTLEQVASDVAALKR